MSTPLHELEAEVLALSAEHRARLVEGNQKLGTPAQGDLRTYPFRRFPYTILYAEDRLKGPQVFAIAHQSREQG